MLSFGKTLVLLVFGVLFSFCNQANSSKFVVSWCFHVIYSRPKGKSKVKKEDRGSLYLQIQASFFSLFKNYSLYSLSWKDLTVHYWYSVLSITHVFDSLYIRNVTWTTWFVVVCCGSKQQSTSYSYACGFCIHFLRKWI